MHVNSQPHIAIFYLKGSNTLANSQNKFKTATAFHHKPFTMTHCRHDRLPICTPTNIPTQITTMYRCNSDVSLLVAAGTWSLQHLNHSAAPLLSKGPSRSLQRDTISKIGTNNTIEPEWGRGVLVSAVNYDAIELQSRSNVKVLIKIATTLQRVKQER